MMKSSIHRLTVLPSVAPALAAAIALALSGQAFTQDQGIDHRGFIPPGQLFPSPKIAVTSSSLEMLAAARGLEDQASEPLELLRTSFDVSRRGGTDLVVRVDGECAAWTNEVADADEEVPEEPPEEPTAGEEESAPESAEAAAATVTVWIELDGQPVAVSGGGFGSLELADDGTVVFCNSGEADLASLQETTALIARFERDRTAKGFNWVVPQVDPGFHELVVKASLDVHAGDDEGTEPPAEGQAGAEEDDPAQTHEALAVFGKRLVVVERTRLEVEQQNQEDTEL